MLKTIASSTITEKVLVGLFLLALLVILGTSHWFVGLIIFSLTLTLAKYSEYTIPANPPSVGIPVLWGTRQNKIVKERLAFVAAPFETFVEIDCSLKNSDTTFKGVRCSDPVTPPAPASGAATPPAPAPRRSGGSVSVKVGKTWEPDTSSPARLNQYTKAGMEAKVNNILSDITGETIREIAAERTWEEVALAKEMLSALVVTRVTGLQPTEKVRRISGKAVRNPYNPDTPKYEVDGVIDPATPIEDLEKEDIEHFLDSILRDGPADVRGLGIRIRRMNVIEVQPEGKLAEDAELSAREKQQRGAEETDFETERRLIKAYRDEANTRSDGSVINPGEEGYVSYQTAAEWVRVNRGRAKENIVRSSGNPLADAASLLGGAKS
ncbi:hypothetical protein EXS62_03165 [Candidatus Kaiserbacteria bacterium]|nr:hypothetical protein [Candidatus Kaiserbacteria bacterium]